MIVPASGHQVRCIPWVQMGTFNTLRPRRNGRLFADDTFNRIFLNENIKISIKISLKFVPTGPINNIPALVQIMAWCRSGGKPLFEPMMVSLLMHICVTRPQWVNKEIGFLCELKFFALNIFCGEYQQSSLHLMLQIWWKPRF